MESFLSVSGRDLERLSATDAVDLFRELLWAEASISGTRIDVPASIYAPDGGIDGTVRIPADSPPPARHSALRPGLTCYQIKTGKSTKISYKKTRNALLFGSAKRHAGNSMPAPRVMDCLEQGGTLVFVLFGEDTPDRNDNAEELLWQDLPKGMAHNDAKIEVWRQNELIGHLARHPALCRRLKGAGHAAYQDHVGWGKSAEMSVEFVKGKQHDKFSNLILAEMNATGRPVDVRITGPPGSGKTRIIYEIAKDRSQASHVLYFENPAPLQGTALLDTLIENQDVHATLIVDECNATEWERLSNRTAPTSGRIRLVTIHNQKDTESAFEVPELDEDEIRQIIKSYGADIPERLLSDLVQWCTPSPRYAHKIGERVKSNLQDFLDNPLDEKRLHMHYIAGRLDLEGAAYKRREAVLLWFGLFDMVGHDRPYSDESAFLAGHLGAHMHMPIGEFDSIVEDLRDLKILQGHKTLYVAPALLRWWLWREWWERNGRRFDLAGLASIGAPGHGKAMPPPLLERLADTFVNAPSSRAATAAAVDMLADPGLFGDGSMLDNRLGARLFNSLAVALPEDALRLLVRTVGTWDDNRLAGFMTGRRDVVQALEEIAPRTSRFADVAELLLRLAVNENEYSASNNASGVFAGLFSMAPGEQMATTPAGIDERLALLAKTLDSPDRRRRLLALDACDNALESVNFVKIDSRRGLVRNCSVDRPESSAIGAYDEVLAMLRGRVVQMEADEQKRAVDTMLKRAEELSWLPEMSARAADTIRLIRDNRLAADERLLETVARVTLAVGAKVDKKAAAAWSSLESDMSGPDYHSRMKRYVGMNLSADVSTRSAAGGDGRSRSGDQIRELAAETLHNGAAFAKEADWIFGPDVKNAVAFGRELGRQDKKHAMLEGLLQAASSTGGSEPHLLLGGYLERVFERDKDLWEDALDTMAADRRLAPSVPEATWRSGLTDKAWNRIVALYKQDLVEKSSLGMFAHLGRACVLSDRALEEATEIILAPPLATTDLRMALALLAGRCRCDNPRRAIPLDAACKVITDADILRGTGELGRPSTNEFDWTAVSMRVIDDDPARIPALADLFLGALGSGGGVFGGGGYEALRVLDRMAAAMPERVWKSAASQIAIPLDNRSRRILQWAGGLLIRPGNRPVKAPALLNTVPPDAIWQWVDKDRSARAACLARWVPKVIRRDCKCIARDILIRYGDDPDVCNAMSRHFLSGHSFSSQGDHFSVMKKHYKEIAEKEDDPNVCRWLDELIVTLDDLIDNGRASDERF